MSEHKHRFGFWYWLPGGAEQQRNCISCPHTEKRDVTLAEEPDPTDADREERLISAIEANTAAVKDSTESTDVLRGVSVELMHAVERLDGKVEANSVCLSRRIEGMEPAATTRDSNVSVRNNSNGLDTLTCRHCGTVDTIQTIDVFGYREFCKQHESCGEASPAEPWPAWISFKPGPLSGQDSECVRCGATDKLYRAGSLLIFLRTHATCKARE